MSRVFIAWKHLPMGYLLYVQGKKQKLYGGELRHLTWGFRIHITSPGWCGSVDWVLACRLKGGQFDSQSGHMSGLQARSPLGGRWEATLIDVSLAHYCFSSSFSPHSTPQLSKKLTSPMRDRARRHKPQMRSLHFKKGRRGRLYSSNVSKSPRQRLCKCFSLKEDKET